MRKALLILFFTCSAIALYSQDCFPDQLATSAIELTEDYVIYDPTYFGIDYPNGDVPADRGVCTDVVIRAYRKMDIDLQKEVHEDMRSNFSRYPNKWGMQTTDRNIDHRRVPNLMTFFTRHGQKKKITQNAADYLPGDIVCWELKNGRPHIGIVINQKSRDGKRHLIVHNIGAGQVMEDVLFDYKIIGHYQYEGT